MSLISNNEIFGLDISAGAIRLVSLKKKGKKIVINSFNELNLPAGIITNGEIVNEDKFISGVKDLVKNSKGDKIKTKNVITVLPETKTFIKVINVSFLGEGDAKRMPELVNEEIVNQIPLALDEIYFDWQVISRGQTSAEILVGAAPKKLVDSYLTIVEKCGLTPYVFEIEAAAISRALIDDKKDSQAKIIIDIGAVRTGLIVYDKGAIQFTVSLPISGNKITQTISKTLNIDLKKAEKAKLVCGLDPAKCEGAMLKILYKMIDNLTSQIKKTITFYQSNFENGKEVTEIILCGGGANFTYIDSVLSDKLKIPVKIGDPLNGKYQIKKSAIPNDKILSFTTAIGLALRAYEKKDII
ncbi:MAG: type IV pilus assembly protein PilM [Patescibacteria group bacterium]|nr:type IV pilus assembly protein PilM [Patescibacteria group bacterium]